MQSNCFSLRDISFPLTTARNVPVQSAPMTFYIPAALKGEMWSSEDWVRMNNDRIRPFCGCGHHHLHNGLPHSSHLHHPHILLLSRVRRNDITVGHSVTPSHLANTCWVVTCQSAIQSNELRYVILIYLSEITDIVLRKRQGWEMFQCLILLVRLTDKWRGIEYVSRDTERRRELHHVPHSHHSHHLREHHGDHSQHHSRHISPVDVTWTFGISSDSFIFLYWPISGH